MLRVIGIAASVAIAVASLLTNIANAQPFNQPPPAGPVILDLNGQPIPHSLQNYSVNFIAASTSTNVSFAFREDPAFLFLDNVSVALTGGGPNLIVNGDFEAGPVGASAPSSWTYLNTFGASFGGFVRGDGVGCAGGSSNCYYDGAVQAYDSITQAIATTIGAQYTLSFVLTDNSSLSTFSALSTNGNITGTGGNGVDLLVYAGSIPTRAGDTPLPGALPLFATGLGALGVLGWRKKRKAQQLQA